MLYCSWYSGGDGQMQAQYQIIRNKNILLVAKDFISDYQKRRNITEGWLYIEWHTLPTLFKVFQQNELEIFEHFI